MSLINFNNLTTDSTKNDLYNSYQAIKNAGFFDRSMSNKKKSLKNKFIEKELKDNISINDSKNYCLTSSNTFYNSKNKIIPPKINNSNSNSFYMINKSFKDKVIINEKKVENLSLTKNIKKIKEKILSLKKKIDKN